MNELINEKDFRKLALNPNNHILLGLSLLAKAENA